ncbi:MAG: hypothetical protein IPM24_25205 [Bryobacterales bacterium]|nr:hypothetical protein [Bryobacterales bacterium]
MTIVLWRLRGATVCRRQEVTLLVLAEQCKSRRDQQFEWDVERAQHTPDGRPVYRLPGSADRQILLDRVVDPVNVSEAGFDLTLPGARRLPPAGVNTPTGEQTAMIWDNQEERCFLAIQDTFSVV